VASSLFAASLAKLDSLPFEGSPTHHFDEAPLRTASGAAIVPPYTVLKDDGTVPDYTFELPIERTTFRLELYARTLAALDAMIEVVKYGGAPVSARAGFDHGTLAIANFRLMELVRVGEQRFREADRWSSDAGLVYRARISYRAQLSREAD